MSAWHRRALDSFPSLRRELRDREYSIYHLFFDLLPMARDAHETFDLATLTRIYAFAERVFCPTCSRSLERRRGRLL
ncbi:MAG: hypothetical protein QOJ59_1898 [Thermomicrobiales bacterium]|jgi:hypothetical protein|nr:hypothetical protein [Thermomicrobiales bacterium]